MELIELTRAGDKDAFGELWKRHYHAALRAARAISYSQEPEDLIQESFTRIFNAIRDNKGPREAFRPYLYTVIRSVSMNWSRSENFASSIDELTPSDEPAQCFEGQVVSDIITARAFAALKPEWRAVLWYSEVEGLTPKEFAPLMGLSANAVSALAYRAREALRTAWLQAHLNSENADARCQWSVEHLGAYSRDALSKREKNKVRDHLVACLKCSALIEEVDQVRKNLGFVLLPAVLGPQGISILDTVHQSDLASNPVPASPISQHHPDPSKIARNLVGSAVVASGVIVASILVLSQTPLGPTSAAPEPTASAAQQETPPGPAATAMPPTPASPAGAADSFAETVKGRTVVTAPATGAPQRSSFVSVAPTAPPPQPSAEVSATATPPAKPAPEPAPSPSHSATIPVQSPQPVAPAEPPAPIILAAPSIESVTEQGLFVPVLRGQGAPGAVVTVLLFGQPVGSTTVEPAGTWSVIPDVTLRSSEPVRFSAYQELDGLVSATAPETTATKLKTPEIQSINYISNTGSVAFRGPEGSIVEVIIDGTPTGTLHRMDGTTVHRQLPSIAPGRHTLTVRFVDEARTQHGAGLSVEFDLPTHGASVFSEPVGRTNSV